LPDALRRTCDDYAVPLTVLFHHRYNFIIPQLYQVAGMATKVGVNGHLGQSVDAVQQSLPEWQARLAKELPKWRAEVLREAGGR